MLRQLPSLAQPRALTLQKRQPGGQCMSAPRGGERLAEGSRAARVGEVGAGHLELGGAHLCPPGTSRPWHLPLQPHLAAARTEIRKLCLLSSVKREPWRGSEQGSGVL